MIAKIKLLSLIAFLTISCNRKDLQNEKKPNIVFVLVDDLGWKDLGIYGSEFYETPNLDQFTSESVMFTNAYSASPVCSPTRASIMTGKYPSRVGITDWIPGLDPKDRKLLGPQDLNELPLQEVTIAEVLKRNNYKTFFAGKWHLGDSGYFPEQQGFDLNFGGHHMGQPPGGYYSPYNNPKLKDGPDGEYLTDRLTNESIKFIEENSENPFFVYLSYYSVHTPIEANKKYVGKFREKLKTLKNSKIEKLKEHNGSTVQNQVNPEYASMVYSLDKNFGRLISKLKKLDLYDNTIIVFTSDNGGLSTLSLNANAPTSIKPLRAGKGWCYEGGIRVPLLIKQQGKSKKVISDFPVVSMDFFPTLLELACLDNIPIENIDGKSLVPLLNGENQIDREAIFWHFPHYHGSMWTPGSAIRKGKWKLVEFYETGEIELYNLKEDLSEKNNLSEKYPEKVKELKTELEIFLDKTNAKYPLKNSNYN
ncbi:MAG: sulfatase [Ignavibacteriales bacterium]|nr:sulfatase [Ignavibacteriales bacterium]MCB9218116.1 sulfatase [Ignavibacteriales bacterium]MCB9260505.1 sulfatase [Ignavibacteriales bacterium]